MCGINGFSFHDPDALRRMHALTRHRGPDAEGFFETPEISFAHNRLSIIDLSEGGRQPMKTPDGRYAIVFNGEIYNYRKLRSQLEAVGESFSSQSDTEVLLRAFAVWGDEAFPKLNGIYAFAIWDDQKKELVLARDPMGVKPLYYCFSGGQIIFSSEIKAILAHGIKREVDPVAFSLYVRMLYVPGERTMFKGIKKLSQGSVLRFSDGSFSVQSWHALSRANPVSSYRDAVEGVRLRTVEAVRRQLVSDRPLGVFLSGGIDSTAVLGIMRDLQPSGTIKTFTIGYESKVDSERFNADADLAKKTAEHFGTDHHAFTLSAKDTIQTMEDVIWHMDEPVANHIQPSTYLIAKYAKPEITVALGGDGGDELFAGYPRYWYAHMAERLHPFLPEGFVRAFFGRRTADKILARTHAERWRSFQGLDESRVSLFISKANPDLSNGVLTETVDALFSSMPKNGDLVTDCLEADLRTWLPDESLVRTDKLSMAHALEARVPLLDLDLVSYAFRIPPKFKLGTRMQGKKVFIEAMCPYLPPHVLAERKRGWMSPTAKWIREEPMQSWIREIFLEDFAPGSEAFLDMDGVQTILKQHLRKEAYGLHEIWLAVTFRLWYRRFISKASL